MSNVEEFNVTSLADFDWNYFCEISQFYLLHFLNFLITWLNQFKSWQLVIGTVLVTCLLQWCYRIYDDENGIVGQVKNFAFHFVLRVPYVKNIVRKEYDSFYESVCKDFRKSIGSRAYIRELPKKGWSPDEIQNELDALIDVRKKQTDSWETGMTSGTVYNGSEELTDLTTSVYRKFAWSNPLHADSFPDVRKMEAEIVRMCCNIYNGDGESCGTCTSGGTESILLVCKASRDRAIARGCKQPTMIIPITAHAAFDKAGQYFQIKVKHIPLDQNYGVDVKLMKAAITKNTCMLVGSAYEFAHGIIDDIQAIGKLGQKYDIPVHVDCCLGGFIMPFMDKAGFPVEPFDFRVPGVSSISCDTHKYAFAPKGNSVILYRRKEFRKYQFFATGSWPGGLYATPTMGGSRPGALSAACWATLMYFGEDGYVNSTRQIVETTRYIVAGIQNIPHLFVMGNPLGSVVAFGALGLNIYSLQDLLTARGYMLSVLLDPPALHLCVTLRHTGAADKFLSSLKECSDELAKKNDLFDSTTAALYGTVQKIPDRRIVGDLTFAYLDAYFSCDD